MRNILKKDKYLLAIPALALIVAVCLAAIFTHPFKTEIAADISTIQHDFLETEASSLTEARTLVKDETSQTVTAAESENKGGNTPEELNDTRNGTDGGNYKVFKPGEDKFEPIDEMTLENRFCAFNYNGLSYYPAPDGELTSDDYEPDKLASVKAEHWELRSANADDDTSGIVYYARIDIYKLKGVETNEAVACVISFNGETKEYRYNAT